MEFLTQNALATMPGPTFLLFYGLIALAVALAFIVLASNGGDGAARAAPVPARPDPYEFAFLRDGPAGVAWLAIYGLKRSGRVELSAQGQLVPQGSAPPADRFESAMLGAIGGGCPPSAVAGPKGPGGSFGALIDAIEQSLEKRGLARTARARAKARLWALGLGAALTALAGYKLAVALGHGHRNVVGLIFEALGADFVLLFAAQRFSRRGANACGRAYLKRVRLAYDGGRSRDGAGSLVMLMVGLNGFAALAGGPDAAFAQQVRQSQSSGDGGGGGGDGGGSCGGGGCGGCGS